MSEMKKEVEQDVKDEELENVSGGIHPFSSTPLSDDDLDKVTGGAYIDQGELVKPESAGVKKLGKKKFD